jgi:hypothetical protein
MASTSYLMRVPKAGSWAAVLKVCICKARRRDCHGAWFREKGSRPLYWRMKIGDCPCVVLKEQLKELLHLWIFGSRHVTCIWQRKETMDVFSQWHQFSGSQYNCGFLWSPRSD